MHQDVAQVVELACRGRDATADECRAAFGAIMDGESSETAIAALLTALRAKGESPEELIGAAAAMRARATPIPTVREGLLDTCGTGGDRLSTFNISTATALVAAAAGVPVAKHGNRSATSTSGSADVLEELGVDITLGPEAVGKCIDELGIGFCFAPLFHGAMRYAAPVRRELGFRTIFNLVGPLTNPASASYQLMGATDTATAEKLAEAALGLGTARTLLVCGADQLDEVALWGETAVFDVADGQVTRRTWSAATFGLIECTADDLRVASPAESAEVIRRVLEGHGGPPRDIVLANAAAAIWCAGHAAKLTEAVAAAAAAIDSGQAALLTDELAQLSQGLST
jgi:anthranilate phosphoribosyltransferase